MNQPATTALRNPARTECELAVMASRAGPAVFAIGIAALEAYLRMPIRLILDCYLQPVLAFAASTASALFVKPSF